MRFAIFAIELESGGVPRCSHGKFLGRVIQPDMRMDEVVGEFRSSSSDRERASQLQEKS